MGKRSTFYLIAIAFFSVSVALTFGEIFSYAFFLASYPSHWLSYLFLATVVLNCLIFIALVPLAKKHDKRINRTIIGVLIALCALFAVLLPFNFYWVPFAFALYYSLLFPTLTIICYNLASDCFSIREFKQYSTRLRATGTVGIILSSFSTNYLTSLLGQQSILYLTLLSLCTIEVILFIVSPVAPVAQKKQYDKKQILNYPLARVLLPMVTLMALGYYFSDYLLKSKLSQELSREGITYFLGNFICILNILSFITQMFITQMMINRYGVIFLFYFAPCVIAVGTLGIVMFPSLFAFTVYALAVSLVYWGIHLIAFEMALSPLPLPIRLAVKTLEGGVLEFIGQGITALFFIGVAYITMDERMTLWLVAIFSIAYCLPWYFLIERARKLYKQALQKAIRVRGFVLGKFCFSYAGEVSREDLAEDLLSLSTSKLHALGYSLILDAPPMEVFKKGMGMEKEEAYDELIKLQSPELLEEKQVAADINFPLEKLQKENSPKILEMVAKLTSLEGSALLNWVEEKFQETISPKQVYLTSIAFTFGDFKLIGKAIQILKQAVDHEESQIRLATATVLGKLSFGNPEIELKKLMQDEDLRVVKESVKAAAARGAIHLIPTIASYLGDRMLSHTAFQALQSFDEEALPELESIINGEYKLAAILAAIKTLAHLKGPNVEDAILRVAHHPNAIIKTRMAYWALMTAESQRHTLEYLNQVYPLISKEAHLRMRLKGALKLSLPSYLHKEFKVKLHLSSLRCLYWFGSYVDPKIVIQLISPLKNIDFGPPKNPERFHSTLELLNSLTNDPLLQNLISEWEKEPKDKALNLKAYEHSDPYLDKFITYYYQSKEGHVEDTMSKLVALRDVTLFEKLSAEVLYVIAKEAEWQKMELNEILFNEGDPPDGLYIVVTGEVLISSKGRELSKLKKHDFFGEIGLIDNSPRLATAKALSDGLLLHIDQITFDDIINEFPDVLRAITSTIIGYLQNPPK